MPVPLTSPIICYNNYDIKGGTIFRNCEKPNDGNKSQIHINPEKKAKTPIKMSFCDVSTWVTFPHLWTL